MLCPNVSASMVKGSLKLGKASVGLEVKACLSVVKAVLASSFHPNWPFFNKLVRGLAIIRNSEQTSGNI